MKKLILAASAGLSSPYSDAEKDLDLAIVDVTEETGDRYGKAVVFSSADFNEALENADEDASELINAESSGEKIVGEEIEVTANKTTQVITPSEGKNAITKVTVSPEWVPSNEFSLNFCNLGSYGGDIGSMPRDWNKDYWMQAILSSEDLGVLQGGEGSSPIPVTVYLINHDNRYEYQVVSKGENDAFLLHDQDDRTWDCSWGETNPDTGYPEMIITEVQESS